MGAAAPAADLLGPSWPRLGIFALLGPDSESGSYL